MFKVHVGLPVKCKLSCALTLAKISKCKEIRFQEIQPLRCTCEQMDGHMMKLLGPLVNTCLIVPTECTVFILYIYCISPASFGAMCTITGENYYAIYLKPNIIIKLLNMVSIAATS